MAAFLPSASRADTSGLAVTGLYTESGPDCLMCAMFARQRSYQKHLEIVHLVYVECLVAVWRRSFRTRTRLFSRILEHLSPVA